MLSPLQEKRWDNVKAAHLLNRAGFGGSPAEVDSLLGMGMYRAVESLLDGVDDSHAFPKPSSAQPVNMAELRLQARTMTEEERNARRRMMMRQGRREMTELTGWWLARMRGTSFQLREKMTLFWHGHFATSVQKVRQPYLMWLQNETLRQHALGNFGALVKAISRDPAMLIWLDTRNSRPGNPNENFARELMELFTVGIGNYSEEDIREAARAFTGYKLRPADQSFYHAARHADLGEKAFLGKRGKFSGDDIIDMLLDQPSCARFIGSKIWEFLVYEDPEPDLQEQIAARFRDGGYEIKPLLRTILTSSEFYSERAIRTQVKSPVQFLITLTRQLETQLPPVGVCLNILNQLGQVPFQPPNVKGWDGGKAWITTNTLLARYNFASSLLGTGSTAVGGPGRNRIGAGRQKKARNLVSLDLDRIVPEEMRSEPHRLVETLVFRLFNGPLPQADTATFLRFAEDRATKFDDATLVELLHLMTSTPRYQLT